MKVIATIEARMGSTRLPGKVMLPLSGQPMILRLVERIRQSKIVDEVVVATTVNPTDRIIVETCERNGIKVLAGSEMDITQRLLDAASTENANYIVQLTGDNPLIDSTLIDVAVNTLIDSQYDYVTNYKVNSLTIGFNVRCFSFSALQRAAELSNDPDDRIHGSYFIHRNPELFSIGQAEVSEFLQRDDIRLTVDEPNDFEMVRRVFETLYPLKTHFTAIDIIELVDRFPEWRDINIDVVQKKIGEG